MLSAELRNIATWTARELDLTAKCRALIGTIEELADRVEALERTAKLPRATGMSVSLEEACTLARAKLAGRRLSAHQMRTLAAATLGLADALTTRHPT